jgi:hypothetical protein
VSLATTLFSARLHLVARSSLLPGADSMPTKLSSTPGSKQQIKKKAMASAPAQMCVTLPIAQLTAQLQEGCSRATNI